MTEVKLYGEFVFEIVKTLQEINKNLAKIEQHIDHFLQEADELDAMKQ